MFRRLTAVFAVLTICLCLCGTGLANPISGKGSYSEPYVTGGGENQALAISDKGYPNDYLCFVKADNENKVWLCPDLDSAADLFKYTWEKKGGSIEETTMVKGGGIGLYQLDPEAVYLLRRNSDVSYHFFLMIPEEITISYDLNGGTSDENPGKTTLYCVDGGDFAVMSGPGSPYTPSDPLYLEKSSPVKDGKPLLYWESNTGVRMKSGDKFDLKALTKNLSSKNIVMKAVYAKNVPGTGDASPLLPLAALACASLAAAVLLLKKRRA